MTTPYEEKKILRKKIVCDECVALSLCSIGAAGENAPSCCSVPDPETGRFHLGGQTIPDRGEKPGGDSGRQGRPHGDLTGGGGPVRGKNSVQINSGSSHSEKDLEAK